LFIFVFIFITQGGGSKRWVFFLFSSKSFIVSSLTFRSLFHFDFVLCIVNKTEIDVFLELSCFFSDPADVGNLISGSSTFSKTILNIWKFTVHVLLKPVLENFEHYFTIIPFSSVQSLSGVRLFATPWIAAHQASLSITVSRSSLRLTSIQSVMPSSHLILCCLLLLLPPIPPSIRVFSNESTLRMRWPKYYH